MGEETEKKIMSTEMNTFPVNGPKGPATISQALNILRPSLPVSLPLYRRLQFGKFSKAATLLSNLESLDSNPSSNGKDQWLIAYVDRACRPETETYTFASWEVEYDSSSSSSQDADTDPERNAVQDAIVRSLCRAIKDLGVPISIHQDMIDGHAAAAAAAAASSASATSQNENKDASSGFGKLSRAEFAGHMANPNIVLCGSVHKATEMILRRNAFVAPMFLAGREDNHTFVFDVDALPPTRDLPPGLTFGPLERKHLALVRSRTNIPRQERTLAQLPSLGIFPEGEDQPVSWAFIGLDGSLSSLHVEDEWRRMGLAKALTARLFREKMEQFWELGVRRLAHGYVLVGNEASSRMCESLGGRSNWEVIWVRMDLGSV